MRLSMGGTLAAAWVVLLVGLAGCSASGGSRAATTTTTGSQDVAAIWHELVQCARANGMPGLPDPQIDAEGQPHFPGGDPGNPPESVMRACRSIIERLPKFAGNDEANPANVPALLQFARCMRSHGLSSFPDPLPDGNFPRTGLPAKGDPAFQTASQACERLNPDPEGRIHVH